jgi:glycosyltransferase involved in cell wall biosynthesis
MTAPKKILFVVNAPEFFLSHRLPLALTAKAEGYEVHVASAFGAQVSAIETYGFIHHVVPFARSGQNPLNEFSTLLQLIGLFRRLEPDLVHLITIKPVLYGGLAARFSGISAVVSAVSGLGTVFLASSVGAKARRWLVKRLYAAAFKQKKLAVIFQNPDDRDALLNIGALHHSETRMIRGSGVDLGEYPYLPEPEGKTVVVMAARLLKDKGVFEFVQAAQHLMRRNVAVEMRLIGSPDPGNPTSVSESDLKNWQQADVVTLLGYRSDIAEQYAAANIVCLPSYREGLPKSLVEAAACGRAVVTTDVPGCRDAITPDVTGVLVPVKDSVRLADALQSLIENPGLRQEMGLKGRRLAEEAFAIEKIVAQHIEIYRDLLEP